MKNTEKLKSDLSKLEADTSELEEKVNSVDNNLIYVHDRRPLGQNRGRIITDGSV